MDLALLFRRSAATFNRAMVPLLATAPGRKVLGGSLGVLSYEGRKSGRQITVPVGYRRQGDDVVINVVAPDAKTWWRNFSGAGAPARLEMGGTVLQGHAVSSRDAKGRVSVRVTHATTA